MTTTKTTTAISEAEAEKIALKSAKSDIKKYAKLKSESAEIKAKAKKIDNKAKAIEERLIAFGKDRRDQFEKNNYDLGAGYLHIAETTKVETKEGFDIEEFAEDLPGCVEMTLKVKELKKAFLDEADRKTILDAGITLTTGDDIEVKLNKK
jgi:hypothetical protein